MMYDVAFARAESRYLDPPEDIRKVCFHCSLCGEGIKEDDDYYEVLDSKICDSCMADAHRYAELDEEF